MTCEAGGTLVGAGLGRDAGEVGRQTGPVPVPGGLITVSTRFDEFAFEVTIRYRGELLEPVAERPSAEAVLENDGHLLLARYLVGRTADRMRSEDRKSVVEGKSVSVRVDLGGSRIIKKKK